MTQSDGLAGKTVILTRAFNADDALALHLQETGVKLVWLACTRQDKAFTNVLVERWRSCHEQAACVVFASRNGVRFLQSMLEEFSLQLDPRLPIAVIGPGTEHEVEQVFGRRVEVVATCSTATGLAQTLAGALSPASGTLLLVQAEDGRPELGEQLQAAGFHVERFNVYRTVKEPPDTLRTQFAADADAILFTSASTVEALAQAVEHVPASMKVITMGPTTTLAAQNAHYDVAAEAHPHTREGLVLALRQCFS